jgi:Type II secretion system (T2SS), protein G
MSVVSHIVSKPLKAWRAVSYIFSHPLMAWRAFTGTERLSDRIKDEEGKLALLQFAIGLYHVSFGRFPEALQDLCHNNHKDPAWGGPFIQWDGERTFRDTFGYPYRYVVTDGRYELVSPGLETAKRCETEQTAGGGSGVP